MQHLRNRRKQKRLLSTYLSLDKMFTRFHHFHSLSMSLSHSSLSFTHPHTFLHWQTFASLANCSHIVSIVTRLDDFWKLFVTNFLTQVAQMYVDFLGSFENIHFGQRLEIFGLLYISASGHTDCKCVKRKRERVEIYISANLL